MKVYQLAVIEKDNSIRFFRHIFDSVEKCRNLMRCYADNDSAAGVKVYTYNGAYSSESPEKFPENTWCFDCVYFIVETKVQ